MPTTIEVVLAVVTAAGTAVAGIPALAQWKAMRERAKIKEDMDILVKLKETHQTLSDTIQEADRQKLQNAISNVCDKILHKTQDMTNKQSEDRDDLDNSSLFLGIAILCSGIYWFRHSLPEPMRYGSAEIQWPGLDGYLSAVLCFIGLVLSVIGFRRKPRFWWGREPTRNRSSGSGTDR